MAEQRDPSGSTPEQPYTIHDDAGAPAAPAAPAAPETADLPLPSEPAPAPGPATMNESPSLTEPEPVRRGPDPVALLAGLATVAVAVLALTDSLTAVDLRWVLAGGAIVVGVIILAAASRPRTRRER